MSQSDSLLDKFIGPLGPESVEDAPAELLVTININATISIHAIREELKLIEEIFEEDIVLIEFAIDRVDRQGVADKDLNQSYDNSATNEVFLASKELIKEDFTIFG